MTLRLWIAPRARLQIRDLVLWWRENRPAAPGHFSRELKRVIAVIAETPNIGTPYTVEGLNGVRRCRLHRTPYHVYYQVDANAGRIKVAAVWSGMRGEGPPLSMP